MRPEPPLLEPVAKGILFSIVAVSASSIGFSFFFATAPAASAELLRTLAGIGARLVAEHRAAGHDNVVDVLGTAWAVTSLAVLAIVVVLQPLLADRYRTVGPDDAPPGP